MSLDATLAESLYTYAPLATFIVRVDAEARAEDRFRYDGWNPACQRLTGLTDEETRGRTPRELVPWLSEETAREWGLYISDKREGSDEPDRFSEPGLFLIRPDGTLYMAQVQSAPFTRPSIDQLLEGVKVITEKDYPPRGTAT